MHYSVGFVVLTIGWIKERKKKKENQIKNHLKMHDFSSTFLFSWHLSFLFRNFYLNAFLSNLNFGLRWTSHWMKKPPYCCAFFSYFLNIFHRILYTYIHHTKRISNTKLITFFKHLIRKNNHCNLFGRWRLRKQRMRRKNSRSSLCMIKIHKHYFSELI